MKRRESDLTRIGDMPLAAALRKRLKPPSAIERRLIEAAAQGEDEREVLYQHSVLCQTCLPFRDPGNDVRVWDRKDRSSHLRIKAGELMDRNDCLVEQGLPFGPKARVIVMHINQRFILTMNPMIEMGESFTDFVCNVLCMDPGGRNLRVVKEQRNRLAAADITLGRASKDGEPPTTEKVRIARWMQLWGYKEGQRTFWPDRMELSLDYCKELADHAVPLDAGHIRALSHSCLALDIYAWLAQRLHRIPVDKPVQVSWAALWWQFGQGYDPEAMFKFRQVFRVALKQVLTQYKTAKIEDDKAGPARKHFLNGKPVWREEPVSGLKLLHSPPPIRKLLK